ncbi:MAG TPA: HoxN/HupN/NixA family nickel/cobalt transporter [Pseudonocardiaceae bacterium]|jgi:high-affinity nickel-transport protein|nr:HoxN/HupN/NixA family nickel/cobalt transporter [Pseudonocardiaceae bacterium]
MATVTSGKPTRRISTGEWASIGVMSVVVIGLHVFGWGTLVLLVAPHRYLLGSTGVFGVGIGATAYTLGLRHAFDADHIAAIDNTTRKLMGEGKRPVSVGFWFSLGHSSIVFGLCFLLGIGVRALAGPVTDDGSSLHTVTTMIGTLVSGCFLLILGILNLFVLRHIVRVFRQMRHGQFDETELERRLNERGFMNRLLGGLTKAVRKPWQMYPVGLLFGLGFDTATEVSLLVLAGGVAAFNLPWYAVLTLPVLFAAGMSLFDSIDGCFMNFAYGWAFAKPVRKVFYNMTITGLSVLVALVVGLVELLGLLGQELDFSSGPLVWLDSLNLNTIGYAIVALFVLTWLVALAVWRFGRIEQRWSGELEPVE